MENKAIALGLTAAEWVNMLSGTPQQKAQTALNYLDGHQEEEVIKVLNDPNSGRRQWKQKGFIPRYRNITKMIVEKSALLFSNSLPDFELYTGTTENKVDTQKLYDELDKIPFQEIMNNADQVLRLLKTIIMLYQYDTVRNELSIDILHRGNCQVVVDGSKQITGLIYTTGDNTYRIFTVDKIIDLMADEMKQPFITGEQDNPYGIVPAAPFYDLRIPRNGLWLNPEYDLVNFNESYNLHLTDADYSMKWAKLPTLAMIDCEVDANSGQYTQEVLSYGDTLPRTMPSTPEVTGGPGSVIHLMSNGQGSPTVQYIAPTPDINSMNEVYDGWCQSIAQDWSVRVKMDGQGSATSGFQVIVEEMPNLELRKQRQRMYEGAFKRAWDVMRTVFNVSSPVTFSENTVLFVEFDDPELPVDINVQEDLWTKRIDSGRATVVDYFMKELDMTEQEAMDKFISIVQFNAMKQELTAVTTPVPEETFVSEQEVQEDTSEGPEQETE